MSVFDETPEEPSSRAPLVVGGVAVLLLLAGGVFLLTGRDDEGPVATSAPAAAPEPTAPPAPTEPEPAPEPDPPAAARPRTAARSARATPPAPVAETARAEAATLTVESDVPGASVFVDREFVGTAPVTIRNVTPGSKRINLSAEGFDGVQRAVDVTPGENTVTLKFKEVRLNTAVDVSHKHGMGGCEGTLRATVDGLSYQTSNKNDAFTLPYAQIETFEINYLDKNLRVKQRGGKTWNFTDKAAANADKLFVFHRDVTAAREKLASGYTAAR